MKKIFSTILFLSALSLQAFAADIFSYKYKYSAAASLLPGQSEKEQNYLMAPSYIVNLQAQHEEVIRAKIS